MRLVSFQQIKMSFVYFFFICVIFSCVKSAVIHVDQVEIPGQEGKCYDKDAKIFYNKGEIIENEKTECVQRKCLGLIEETGKLRIEILTCPAVKAGPGCTIVQDSNKPYPECCPQLVPMPSIDSKFCEREVLEKE